MPRQPTPTRASDCTHMCVRIRTALATPTISYVSDAKKYLPFWIKIE